jgi:hypothetical protein
MGEYIKLDGRSYKVGTCESLYYCRFEDLREWIAAGRVERDPSNDEPRAYMGGAYRFRFPFPDEDGPEAERIAAYQAIYERGVTVTAPAELFTDVEHNRLYKLISPRNVAYFGVNVSLPCPLAPDTGEVKPYPAPSAWHLYIVQQRPFEGALWTVVGCAWCDGLWRLDPDRGRLLAEWITEHGRAVLNGYPREGRGNVDSAGKELARRILAGYETTI